MMLSVCIPTYNRGTILNKTLSLLLPQVDFDICEIIICDNASTDETEKNVSLLKKEWPHIKYFKNDHNVGLDRNTVISIQKASSEYVWLLSDDDFPLPGIFQNIIQVITDKNPVFAYLNHAGYFEKEEYSVVLSRNKDLSNIEYSDPEEMIRNHIINHFSSMIFKRDLALKEIDVVEEYRSLDFQRGYCLVIPQYIILKNKGIYLYIGKVSLAVRNPDDGNNYNPLTTLIDTAAHFQLLNKKGLISSNLEHSVLNWFLRGFYTLVVPRKCKRHSDYNKEIIHKIVRYCFKYKNFKLFLLPFILIPQPLLYFPYILLRTLKRIHKRFSLPNSISS